MDDVEFRHRGWTRQRDKILAALIEVQGYSKRVHRFTACGSNAWVVKNVDDRDDIAVRSDYCTDRFCVPCMNARSTKLSINLMDHYRKVPLRFITLTLKNIECTLAEALDHLYSSFARLRRSKLWKATVDGGIAFTEIKLGSRSGKWHPHLHIIVTGRYIPQAALSKVWFAITKTSHMVDVQFIRNRDKATSYIAKYATKGWSNDTVNDPAALIEAIKTLHGRRLYIKFGDLVGIELQDPPSDTEWETVGQLQTMMRLAKEGDAFAIHIMTQLTRRDTPCTELQHPKEGPPPSNLGP